MTVKLNDKFDVYKDRIFISGTQAIVRLCLMQAELDRRAGLNTAGYVSGYRGSPLGGLDQQFLRAQKFLEAANIVFEPGLNEDLSATAIWGTQQAQMRGEGIFDGVFSVWYGKGPGVDRSGDVFRHANLAGTSPFGGVLVLMGDDHTCESSTTCHQSEYALMDAMIPILSPANAQEIIDFGLHGWALSRFAGVWCGLKCVKDNVESTASLDSNLLQFESTKPHLADSPEGGLDIRPNDPPLAQEARLHQHKLRAVLAYAQTNKLDKVMIGGSSHRRVGIVSTGKSFMDTLQALSELGLNEKRCNKLGLELYKVAMPWPLEPMGITKFAQEFKLIIVVEEKRGLIEGQLKQVLYGNPSVPVIIGKRDESGQVLFQSEAALNPVQIAEVIGLRLSQLTNDTQLHQRTRSITHLLNTERDELETQKKPYFCAGCPHNSSTVIPQGSRGYAGIGCHWMVQSMDRGVEGYTHMGGEGANWIGESKFSTRKHIFQQIGDGTFNHSGIMAIRAATAAGTNITFKLLYNDAVAMTGGQPNDGGLDVYAIANEVSSLPIKKLVVVSDNPDNLKTALLPEGSRIEHRDQLISIQKYLAKIDGVTVLIYEQTCAAEKRRRRKRGVMEDPARRVFINATVCEGCGDCGVQSNCVAIVPLETEFGRKRKIDQSICNKDFSCVNGFCPSFVTVEGGKLRVPTQHAAQAPNVPEPINKRNLEKNYSIVVAGIGGTGVVTIAALLGMAAHIENHGCGIIDMAGLAQKGGAVVSHIKLAETPDDIKAIRIAAGGADLILGCDLLVSADQTVTRTLDKCKSHIIANVNTMMPGDFTRNPDLQLPVNLMQKRLSNGLPTSAVFFVDATRWATALMGDSIAVNLFILGVAYQRGLIPLSNNAINRAIELNDIAVDFNKEAFAWGRLWAHDATKIQTRFDNTDTDKIPQTLNQLVALNASFLSEYQNTAYAQRFQALIDRVNAVDTDPGHALTRAVAENAFKLMAYKDEYEVARLYSNGLFEKTIQEQFDGHYRLNFHLAPPLLSRPDPESGMVGKRTFGPWVLTLFRFIVPFRGLRGTLFDPFGYTPERKTERALIAEYFALIEDIISHMDQNDYQCAVDLARLPKIVRGFGHVKTRNIEIFRVRTQELIKLLRYGPAQGKVA